MIEFQLLLEKKVIKRLDVWPFILIYLGLFYWFIEVEEDDTVYPKLGIIGAVFLNCIAYLFTVWSPRMKSRIGFEKVGGKKSNAKLMESSHVLVNFTAK
jgi:hypothetical protein